MEYFRDLGIQELYVPLGTPSMLLDRDVKTAASPAQPAQKAPEPNQLSLQQGGLFSAPAARKAPEPNEQSSKQGMLSSAAGPTVILPSLIPDNDSLLTIREDIGNCTRCRLHQGRKNIVFGIGDSQAKLVFVGEGPGADEDEQGIPFVGRAGQLLTRMIEGTAEKEGIPIRREDVYICNVVKCRPPGNRTPEADEMETCGQFLFRQIMAIRPRAICALGGTAAKALLGSKVGVTKLRGNWTQWRDIPLMVTYHPSFLLRAYNQEKKKEAWQDLKQVLHFVYDTEERPGPARDL